MYRDCIHTRAVHLTRSGSPSCRGCFAVPHTCLELVTRPCPLLTPTTENTPIWRLWTLTNLTPSVASGKRSEAQKPATKYPSTEADICSILPVPFSGVLVISCPLLSMACFRRSIVVPLFFLSLVCQCLSQANCDPKVQTPLFVPITNVTLPHPVTRRGVAISVGTPPQPFAFSVNAYVKDTSRPVDDMLTCPKHR